MTMTPDAIRRAVLERLAEAVQCRPEQIDPQAPFASYGLGSRDAVVLSGDLEELLGRPLSPTVFYEHPTLDALVSALSATTPAVAAPERAPDHSRADVAIVGIACRFPGARDLAAFRELLYAGRDAIRRMPRERRALLGEHLAATIPDHGLFGGFVDDADAFDAPFFGIGAPEAEGMDPQQRLLLELAWHALEDAGQPVDRLAGSRTGVFVGLSTADYALLRMRMPEGARIDTYSGTSNSPSVAAGRIAYVLGLQGPTYAIDTACSSSLAAVHLAGRALRDGECDLALAGGVNLIVAPDATIWACQARILSEDGRCRTFDHRANGYVRGEGGGFVVLKRLPDALRDGDPVVAVIRGSAVNHDGRSSGLTAPNGLAQQRVIEAALADARVDPADVQYLEAHGTGTILGDPIEVRAVGAALCRGRSAAAPLVIGSVKTNIGHLEAAAGIAGLIKAAVALHDGRIPAHLHLTALNPYIAAEHLPIAVPASTESWPGDAPMRVAGVSSFGLSGTNVHVVLAAPPARVAAAEARADSPDPVTVLPISARSESALRQRVADLTEWLRQTRPHAADVAATAGARRAHHRHRLAVWGTTAIEWCDALDAWLAGAPHPRVLAGVIEPAQTRGSGEAATGLPLTPEQVARFYVAGETTMWQSNPGARVVALPAYPFDRHRYWIHLPSVEPAGLGGPAPAAGIAAAIDAADPGSRDAVLLAHLQEGLARALQTAPHDVQPTLPLASLGLDSLMAIDLTNRLANELGVQVPPVDLLEKMTLAELTSLVLDLRAANQVRSATTGAAAGATEEIIL